MIDETLLRETIDKSGLKLTFLAEEVLGITVQSLGNKMNGRTDFSLSEVYKLSKKLNLSSRQRDKIFFKM